MGVTRILFQGDGAALGVLGPLVIAVTDGPNSFRPEYARRVLEEVTRLRRTTHADRLIYLYVAGEHASLPDPEVRDTVAQVAEHFDACVGVHEGTGFKASAVRAVIAGITLLSRSRVRPEIVATIQKGAETLAENHADLGTRSELLEAILDVRAAANA